MQLAVNIVVLASIYALISCGYVLIYRVSRVLSLAHGELMLLGAYGLYSTASLFSGSPALAVAMALVLATMIGLLVYALLMRRMTGESVLAAVLVTIALGILVRGLTVLVWSTQEQHPLNVLGWPNASLPVGHSARISAVGLAFVLVTAAVASGVPAMKSASETGPVSDRRSRMRVAGRRCAATAISSRGSFFARTRLSGGLRWGRRGRRGRLRARRRCRRPGGS